MFRIFGVGGLLLLGAGCFQVEDHLVIDAHGGGRYTQSLVFLPATSKLIASVLPEEELGRAISMVLPSVNAADKRALAEVGLSKLKVKRAKGAAGGEVDVRFSHIDGLRDLNDLRKQTWAYALRPVEGGDWVLERQDTGAGSRNPFADLSEEMKKGPPDVKPAEAMALLGGAFAEMGELYVEMTVTVPGRIVEVTPPDLFVVDGDTATLRVGVDDLMPDGGMDALLGGSLGGASKAAPELGDRPTEAGAPGFPAGLRDLAIRFHPARPMPPLVATAR